MNSRNKISDGRPTDSVKQTLGRDLLVPIVPYNLPCCDKKGDTYIKPLCEEEHLSTTFPSLKELSLND